MGNLMKRATAFILTAALAFSLLSQTTAFAASKKNYVTRGYVLQQIEKTIGATKKATKSEFSAVTDVKKGSKYYKAASIAVNAGLVTPNKAGHLNLQTRATKNFVAGVLANIVQKTRSKVSGNGSSSKFTSGSFKKYLKKQFPNVVTKNNVRIKKGNVVIKKPVTLSNKMIKGDLIIGDGVGDKEVTFNKITVTGNMVVRGSGEVSLNDVIAEKVIISGTGSSLKIDAASSIKEISINAADVEVSGDGKVDTVYVNAQNAVVTVPGAKIEAAPGITVKTDDSGSTENTDDNGGNSTSGNTSDNTDTDSGTTDSSTGGSASGSATSGGSTIPSTDPGTSAGQPEDNNNNSGTKEEKETLSYKGYDLRWSDDFNGNSLNRDDWNVETHEPGWVNAELQEYVDSDENISVKDGKLYIKPVKKTVDGKDVYTSGRINTQGKHDFKYGLFEVRAKVPAGKGYLPAFWMMPTDENLYGQWPKCGEIDAMEVMGQETNKVYGTIHYGEPHAQSQGTRALAEGDFSNEFHTFSVEWEPGVIKWYVDGNLYHEESDWFSAAEGQGTVAYPAPFDQPFYMILNLAVGGSWVGYPDDTTNFDDQAYVIDYVKAYQKTEGYDESNVKKPEKGSVTLRNPDATGNYVNNADFSTSEDLTDETDWQFLTALEGEASAEIVNDEKIGGSAVKIQTTNKGTVDYSVQLLQHKIPLKKGTHYKLTFDAYSEQPRTMYAGVGAIGDRSWKKYVNSEISLTTEKQTFTSVFDMSDDDYENARIEFNMGNINPASTIYISNVRLEATGTFTVDESRTVRADGNYIYNGGFQEGTGRTEFWDIVDDNKKADVSVTDLTDGRRLKVKTTGCSSPDEVKLQQTELPVTAGKYALCFDAELAEAAGNTAVIDVTVAGKTNTFTLTEGEKKTYTYKFDIADDATIADIDDIIFALGINGTVLLDNVRIVEDTLIKNGSFNAGTSGFDIYVDGSASASYVVDSQKEKNALDLTIKNTGDQEWKIQVKQSNVTLEKDKCYELKFDIRSSLARSIQYSIQRDGSVHKTDTGAEDWQPYVQETIALDAYGEDGAYSTVSKKFKMNFDTDEGSIFNIALGGGNITDQHRICIDNISLEEIDESEMPSVPTTEAGENLIKNADFSDTTDSMKNWAETIANWEGCTAQAVRSIKDGAITYDISNVGTEDWHVQLKQSGITLEKGATYKASFKVTSTEARTIKLAFLDSGYAWYGGEDIALEKGGEKTVECIFRVDKGTNDNISMNISMGQIKDNETLPSTITMSDFSLIKL